MPPKELVMKYKKEHEPQLKDMDDYHKPMPKKKLRVVIWSFIALGAVWALFKLIAMLMV
jgi:hypothetical protein